MSGIFSNFPLWSALLAIGIAQFVKVPLHFISHRKIDLHLIFSTGGMPSSHSAAVTALATAVGLVHGFESSVFAISLIIGVIVMFDAMGVRRHAGTQAAVLNKLVEEFNKHLSEGIKPGKISQNQEKRAKLKELLGHQPIEVVVGGLVGIAISLIIYYI